MSQDRWRVFAVSPDLKPEASRLSSTQQGTYPSDREVSAGLSSIREER